MLLIEEMAAERRRELERTAHHVRIASARRARTRWRFVRRPRPRPPLTS